MKSKILKRTKFEGTKTVKGRFFWKKTWYSFCSTHVEHDNNCPRCNAGHWSNNWLNAISGFFFKYMPKFWIWWVNNV